MKASIKCSICGKLVEINPWNLAAYMEAEINEEPMEPFICEGCQEVTRKEGKRNE